MWLRRYVAASALATLVLLTLGGLVSTTESGLACPDWPLCEGKYIPEMKDGKEYEHTHRLAASFVGVMAFGMCALFIKHRRKDRLLVGLGVGAAVLVTVQALLGALTVWMKLPAWVSSTHLATAFLFFSLVTSLAFLVPQRAPGAPPRAGLAPQWGKRILIVVGLAYAQIVVGGVMRHTRGGLACGYDFPLCHGALWPIEGTHLGMQAHLVHRFLGMAVGVAMLWLGFTLRRQPRLTVGLRRLSTGLMVAVVAQVALGIWSIWSSRDLMVMTAHSTLGAVFYMGLISLYWMARPSRPPARVVSAPTPETANLELA